MDESCISLREKEYFVRRWTEMKKIFYPEVEDINVKNNLKGIFRRCSDIKTSSGVRCGKVL